MSTARVACARVPSEHLALSPTFFGANALDTDHAPREAVYIQEKRNSRVPYP